MLIRQDLRIYIIKFFYAAFFIFLIHRLFFPSLGLAERYASYALFPFLKIHTMITHSIKQKKLKELEQKQLIHIIDILRIERDLLKGRLYQLESELIFFQQTHHLQDFAQKFNEKDYYVSKILMRYTKPEEDAILMEGGLNKEISKDDIVIFKNSLIGKIIEVYPWYSKALLISDKRCRIAAQIQHHGGQGVCCGKNDGNLELCFIANHQNIAVGQLVFSTGQGLIYPHGFALGSIKSIENDLAANVITVQPAFNIDQLEYVGILRKNQKKDLI